MKDLISYVAGTDESELAKVKAERDYALHCLEREIAVGESDRRKTMAEIERLREQLAMGRSSFGEAMKENDRLREQLASAREALNEIFRYSHDHHIYERALRARNKIDAALTDDQRSEK